MKGSEKRKKERVKGEGSAAAAMMVAAAKKRGRPRKQPDAGRHDPPSPPLPPPGPRRTLRSRRRCPLLQDFADFDDYLDEEEEEEQERREKRRKLNLILRTPPPVPTSAKGVKVEMSQRSAPQALGSSSRSPSASSSSHSDDDEGKEDEEGVEDKPLRRPQFDGLAGACLDGSDAEEGSKTVPQRSNAIAPGLTYSSLAAGTPLPEKKLLDTILDKIQKKDKYRVFAQPVDPKELPDYYDVIEKPMDFGTLRKKLANNDYHSFEQFEDDFFLICSNAMQYNAPHTIYFRQARSMKDLGTKEFQKIRAEDKCNETEHEQKITFNSKLQNCLPRVVEESFVSDISSAANLASREDSYFRLTVAEANVAEPATTSNGIADVGSSPGKSKSEVFNLNVRNSPSRLGQKLIEVGENRRATYNISDHEPTTDSGLLYNVLESKPRLVDVGLDTETEYTYARSLARFAVNLGSVGWSIVSQKIESVLPSGVKFGRGWVGEYEPVYNHIVSLENHPNLQQYKLDINATSHHKMPLKNKTTTMGRKSNGRDDLKKQSIQSQQGTRNYNESDPMKEGYDSCVTIEATQSSNIISQTQLTTDADMVQQQNKQVTLNIENAGGRCRSNWQKQQLDISTALDSKIKLKKDETTAIGIKSNVKGDPKEYSIQNQHGTRNYNRYFDSVKNGHDSRVTTGPKQSSNAISQTQLIGVDMSRQQKKISSSFTSSSVIGSLDRKSMEHGFPKQAETLTQCSNTNEVRVNDRILSDGKALPTSSSNSIIDNSVGSISNHQHELDIPSRSMSLPIKTLNHSSFSRNSVDSSKLFQPAAAPTVREGFSTAAEAAAQAWMSVGASSESKLILDRIGVGDNPNQSTSTSLNGYSWRTTNSSPMTPDASKMIPMSHTFGQSIQAAGLEHRLHNKGVVIFPQSVATNVPTPWSGPLPQRENKHDQNICPPDLNISFQASGSPVQHSGIQKDTKQPDLALQL